MDTETLAVTKEIVIERSRQDTFRIFTEELSAWWPIATHSINGDDVVGVEMEPFAGGRIYERTTDGTECDWGTVLEWDAPGGFTVSWKPNLDPNAHRTTWTISFESVSDEVTRIELVHTGWEGFGEGAGSAHAAYQTGWDLVLGAFLAATPERQAPEQR